MKYTFEKIEKYLDELGVLTPMEKSISTTEPLDKDIFLTLFKQCVSNYKFSDKQGIIDEKGWNRRSIGDLYRIYKNVYPEIRLQDIYNILIELIKDRKMYSWICTDANKRIYGVTEEEMNIWFRSIKNDEFGYDFTGLFPLVEQKTSYSGYGYDLNCPLTQIT